MTIIELIKTIILFCMPHMIYVMWVKEIKGLSPDMSTVAILMGIFTMTYFIAIVTMFSYLGI